MKMEMITDVQIDMYGEMQYYMVSAKQGDKATRYIRVQLMNNGNEFQIPDDVILIANIKKPDGKFCYNECEKRDNRVIVQLTNQALAAAGKAYCDIEMRSENGDLILSSAAFEIEIEPSMRNEKAIESSNEITVLDKRIQKCVDDTLRVSNMRDEIEVIKENVENTYQNYINALNVYYEQLTMYTDQKIADLIGGAPSTLDTLGEIAQAMQDNEDVVEALNSAIGSKANEAEFDSYKNATDAVLGNTNISAVGDGTVTGAISSLNTDLGGFSFYPEKLTQAEYDALPEETKAIQGLIFVIVKE